MVKHAVHNSFEEDFYNDPVTHESVDIWPVSIKISKS